MAAPVVKVAQAIAVEGEKDKKPKVKWLKHYSSAQSILIVGDGDFSFSLALATAFGSGENLVSTSLDSHGDLALKYYQAQSNVIELKKLGATVLHDVNANTMKLHSSLKMKHFDRIVFNFPHAGFKASEMDSYMIHLVVKSTSATRSDILTMLGISRNSHLRLLSLAEKVNFQKYDYPGYENKRGDGARCHQSFPLGDCCTFKFCMITTEPEEEIALVSIVAALAKVNVSENDTPVIKEAEEEVALVSVVAALAKVNVSENDTPVIKEAEEEVALVSVVAALAKVNVPENDTPVIKEAEEEVALVSVVAALAKVNVSENDTPVIKEAKEEVVLVSIVAPLAKVNVSENDTPVIKEPEKEVALVSVVAALAKVNVSQNDTTVTM